MLRMEKVSCEFEGLSVLEEISLSIKEDEIAALMGPSGCGKSTLLNLFAGFCSPSSGKIDRNGEKMAFVFQDDRLLPWKTVWENIAVVREQEDKKEIAQLIEEAGLAGFENYKPDKLSGGMKKRLGIARAFYYHAPVLLMDEPFVGLDYCLRQEMMGNLLKLWEKRKSGVLLVTHEMDEAFALASRIIVLSHRPARIAEEFWLTEDCDRDKIRKKLKEYLIGKVTQSAC